MEERLRSVSVFGEGQCQVKPIPGSEGGKALLVGSDGTLRQFDLRTLQQVWSSGEDLCTTLDIAKDGKLSCVANEDFWVYSVNVSDGKSIEKITRLTADVKQVRFNPSGTSVAICGDEHSIKIVNLVDTSQVVLFKGHSTSVRSIAFDPQGKFLASSGLDGKIRVWDTTSASGSSLAAVLTDVPLAKDNDQIMLKASWHPSGNYLAIPGFKVINVYNRNSWTLDKTLQDGGHEANVSIVTFSHDGRYLASCGMDLKIFIWDFEKGETIEFTDTSRPLCSLEWNFHDEAIIATNWFGQLIIWDSPLSEALPDAAPLSKSLDDVSMDLSDELTLDSSKRKGPSEGENKKKKLKKSSTIEGVSEKNVFSEDDLENEADLSETVIPDFDEFSDRPRTQEEAGGDNIEIAAPVHLQEPIQIGSTPLYNGRRFLAWNLIGSIDSQETETHNVIQIQFSDVSFHKPLRFNDHFGFQLGAIGNRGAVLASFHSQNPDGPSSTILFRPFNSWASNNEWRVSLENEEARCVTIGQRWLAVGTSSNNIRVFSLGGRQMMVFSLPGPIIALAGYENLLAITFFHGVLTESGVLSFLIFDTLLQSKVSEGYVAISPDSELQWFGFSESGVLISIDTSGVMRGLFKKWSSSWVPMIESKKLKKNPKDVFWPVGITSDSVMYGICKNGQQFPLASSKPVLSAFPLRISLLNAHMDYVELEGQHLLKSLLLSESFSLDDGNEKSHHKDKSSLDKIVLKLVRIACEEDDQFRALDLCTCLYLQKSLEIAITIANHFKLSVLSQKMNLLLKSKFLDAPVKTQTTLMEESTTYSEGITDPSLFSSSSRSSVKQEMAIPALSEFQVAEGKVSSDSSKSKTPKSNSFAAMLQRRGKAQILPKSR